MCPNSKKTKTLPTFINYCRVKIVFRGKRASVTILFVRIMVKSARDLHTESARVMAVDV